MIVIPKEIILAGLRACGLAFALSFLLSPVVMALLRSMKAKQSIHEHAPEGHKVKEGTPTMGGLIVLAGLIPALVIDALQNGSGVYYIVALVVSFALIGFLDDYVVPKMNPGSRGLSWLPKLVLQIAAASFAAPALGFAFHPVVWSVVIIVVLFFANAFNFADGLDSLAGSLGIAFAVGLAIISVIAQPLANLAPLLAVVGALIPFLFINAPPARVFMGDTGSLPIGALFGLMALAPVRTAVIGTFDPVGRALETMPDMAVPPLAMVLPVLVLSLMMVAELVPVPLQVAFFKLTKGKRLFPMTPIHHSFEKKGWKEGRIVWTFLWVQVVLAIIAIFLTVNAVPVSLPQSQ